MPIFEGKRSPIVRPPWEGRHQVVVSSGDQQHHSTFKEYFDKPCIYRKNQSIQNVEANAVTHGTSMLTLSGMKEGPKRKPQKRHVVRVPRAPTGQHPKYRPQSAPSSVLKPAMEDRPPWMARHHVTAGKGNDQLCNPLRDYFDRPVDFGPGTVLYPRGTIAARRAMLALENIYWKKMCVPSSIQTSLLPLYDLCPHVPGVC